MCGLIGCVYEKGTKMNILRTIHSILESQDNRGVEGGGVLIKHKDSDNLIRLRALNPYEFFLRWNELYSLIKKGDLIIFHHRIPTSNVNIIIKNHPFINEDRTIGLIHNGIIPRAHENYAMLKNHGHKFESETNINNIVNITDSELILHEYEDNLKEEETKGLALLETEKALCGGWYGSMTIALIHSDEHLIRLFTNSNSLYSYKYKGNYYFSSENPKLVDDAKVTELSNFRVYELSTIGLTLKELGVSHQVYKGSSQWDYEYDSCGNRITCVQRRGQQRVFRTLLESDEPELYSLLGESSVILSDGVTFKIMTADKIGELHKNEHNQYIIHVKRKNRLLQILRNENKHKRIDKPVTNGGLSKLRDNHLIDDCDYYTVDEIYDAFGKPEISGFNTNNTYLNYVGEPLRTVCTYCANLNHWVTKSDDFNGTMIQCVECGYFREFYEGEELIKDNPPNLEEVIQPCGESEALRNAVGLRTLFGESLSNEEHNDKVIEEFKVMDGEKEILSPVSDNPNISKAFIEYRDELLTGVEVGKVPYYELDFLRECFGTMAFAGKTGLVKGHGIRNAFVGRTKCIYCGKCFHSFGFMPLVSGVRTYIQCFNCGFTKVYDFKMIIDGKTIRFTPTMKGINVGVGRVGIERAPAMFKSGILNDSDVKFLLGTEYLDWKEKHVVKDESSAYRDVDDFKSDDGKRVGRTCTVIDSKGRKRGGKRKGKKNKKRRKVKSNLGKGITFDGLSKSEEKRMNRSVKIAKGLKNDFKGVGK